MSEFDDILLETSNLDIDNVFSDQNPIKLNYDQLKQELSAIRDKSTIQWIDRSNCSLDKLEGNTFDGFYHLTDLDLSHNILRSLPRGVFDQLFNLKTVNLSHNMISEFDDSVFKNNNQLMIINLSSNSLNNINSSAFYNLPTLLKLDFSYNRIERLSERCVISESLEELNLSNNLINYIHSLAFWRVPNLINLQLNNNNISSLNDVMFKATTKIENLNFSNNLIRKLDKKTFVTMNNLTQVDFSNNLLSYYGNSFKNKPMLYELNLLNNFFKYFRARDFIISKNVRKLKLTLIEPHRLEIIKALTQLSDFELHIKYERIYYISDYILSSINASIIKRLHLVIQVGKFNVANEISNFINLEFLHIEFLESNEHSEKFDMSFHLNRMPKLKHLALRNINKLTILVNRNIQNNYLTYLDLTRVQNKTFNFLKDNFVMLEYLNLSFSKIEYISQYWLITLPNLKYLIMNNTGIFILIDNLFQYNTKLKIIDFKDCQIQIIRENCFQNLEKLDQIDIRGNVNLRITQTLLNGIPKSAVVYFD